jgi:hypothetical protein
MRMKEKNIINPQSSAFLWERSDRRILHRTEKRLVRDYNQRKQFGSKALHGANMRRMIMISRGYRMEAEGTWLKKNG